MSSYVYAVALGIAYALVFRFSQKRSSRKKAEQRFPEQMERWQRLDRRTRKSLTNAMRAGQAVPAEHAAIVIEMIDMSIAVEGELLPGFRRRVIRGYAVYLILLLALLAALFLGLRAALHRGHLHQHHGNGDRRADRRARAGETPATHLADEPAQSPRVGSKASHVTP